MAKPVQLGGAYARIERADKHLREVISEIDTYKQSEDTRMVIVHDEFRNQPNYVMLNREFLPDPIYLAVSDCIHNLRSSLDFLIYELAINDSGTVQNRTQFPIVEIDTEFQRLTPKYLRGLSQAHVNAIEDYQPYKGVNWTKTLRDISNPDKHRHLVAIETGATYKVKITDTIPDDVESLPGKVFKGVGKDRADVYVERDFALNVIFEDGLPVVETLEILKRQVSEVIDSFSLEFKV